MQDSQQKSDGKPVVKMRPRRERSTDLPPGMTITHEYGDDPHLLANTLRWLLKQPIAQAPPNALLPLQDSPENSSLRLSE